MADILKNLNQEQLEAVTTTEGPLLIIAGAGTGKTTVIARRIAHIIEKKLAQPAEILALTFTDKAAAEMEERVDVLVPYGFIDTWISTFHAFGDRVLRENAYDVGLAPNFKVLSRPQQVLFFGQNLFRIDLDYYRPLSNPTKFISAVLSFFSRLKDENISPQEFLLYAKRHTQNAKEEDVKIESDKYQELANAYQAYEQFKDEAGVLDFGDQVVKTLNLLKKRPQILKDYQNKFKYILVDEYQDTNFAQNELVNLLAQKSQNICIVGDDDQSIYKFRGAAISNIMEFKKTYPKAKQVVLTQNYRSTQAILDSAYKLIKHNDPDRLEVQNQIDKKLITHDGQGITPKEILADTISEEADLVAQEIEKLMSKNNVKGYQYRDFAILVRANSQADPFLRALNMRGIPHKFVGSTGLYQQEEVGVLISFLNVISNLEDSLNLYNLVTSEIYSLSPIDGIKLTSFAKRKNRPLFFILKNLDDFAKDTNIEQSEDISSAGKYQDKIEITTESKAIVEKIIQDMEAAINLSRKESAGKVAFAFLKRTGYLQKLESIPPAGGGIEGQLKVQNIAKFFDKIKEFENIAQADTVSQFVDYLNSSREAGDDPATVEFDPDLDAVNVMTVHSAKGLEFPVVFLVGLVSDRFPTRARKEPIEMPQELIKETLPAGDWHIQEERRLFYVGMTRAKDLLWLTWSRDVGGARIKKISPFVQEALGKVNNSPASTKLSPLEKIKKFAPVPPKNTQTMLLDVDVLKLTQGSIDDYLTCAYKYRYVHILKIPILKHHAIVYGSALHGAVAQFWKSKKRGQMLTLPQVLEVFESLWDSEGFLSLEHEHKRKNQGKLVLENFYKREAKSPEVPSLIETGFKFSLTDITVVGRYDRVDVKEGQKVRIIDYKSSENIDQKRANAQAKESIQLAIYALSYYKAYKIIPEYVGLHFLENGQEGGYAPTMEDIKKAEELILSTAQKIARDAKNNTFAPNPKYFGNVPACNYCAYNTICPFSLAKV